MWLPFRVYIPWAAPEDYRSNTLSLREGQEISREDVIKRLVEIQYERNELSFTRNKFRAKGDTLEIFPAGGTNETAIRVEFFGDEIDRISEFDALTGQVRSTLKHVMIFPASHYIVDHERLHDALQEITREMEERVKYFTENNKLIEAQRIEQRTRYDMEMLGEIGACKGVENYSRILAGHAPGSTPITLIDHFPKDFLLFVDESHVTLPQVRGHVRRRPRPQEKPGGLWLPPALRVRQPPAEFRRVLLRAHRTGGVRFRDAGRLTRRSIRTQIVEQVIRPTGLLDPRGGW